MAWSLPALVRLARGALHAIPGESPWAVPDIDPAWASRRGDAIGFEVRLNEGDDRLDVAFLVSASGPSRATWLAQPASAPGGDGVSTFVAAWSDPSSVLHAHVRHVWLEFDQHRDGRWPGPPFVTFGIDPRLVTGGGSRPLARLGAVVSAGLTALVGPAGRDVIPSVLAAAGMIPRGGHLAHLAAMPHRGTTGARAVVAIPIEAAAGVLRTFGWPGDVGTVERTLGELWPHAGRVSLNVDFTPAVGPRLGVELFRPTAPCDDPAWDPLLAGLTRRGLCSPARRALVAAWPARRPEDDRRGGRLERHALVKLVFDTIRLVEAKAYLSAEPRLALLGGVGR